MFAWPRVSKQKLFTKGCFICSWVSITLKKIARWESCKPARPQKQSDSQPPTTLESCTRAQFNVKLNPMRGSTTVQHFDGVVGKCYKAGSVAVVCDATGPTLTDGRAPLTVLLPVDFQTLASRAPGGGSLPAVASALLQVRCSTPPKVVCFRFRTEFDRFNCLQWNQCKRAVHVLRLDEWSPNVFVRGLHKLLHNSSRAGYLTQRDCFEICYILPNR